MFDLQAITGDNTALSNCAPTFRAPGLSVEVSEIITHSSSQLIREGGELTLPLFDQ